MEIQEIQENDNFSDRYWQIQPNRIKHHQIMKPNILPYYTHDLHLSSTMIAAVFTLRYTLF